MKLYWLLLIIVTPLACKCTPRGGGELLTDSQVATQLARTFSVNAEILSKDLAEFTQSPHPMGSVAQQRLSNYLSDRIKSIGGITYRQEFVAETPNPAVESIDDAGMRPLTLRKNAANIYAQPSWGSQKPCRVMLGSHYDTKFFTDFVFVGANDSGSSSVLLLQLLDFFQRLPSTEIERLKCSPLFVWFDGEEAVLDGWTDGESHHPSRIIDNTYGSRYAAGQLTDCGANKCLPEKLGAGELRALILLDMVGHRDLRISRDLNSTPQLRAILERAAKNLQLNTLLGREIEIADDHLPFIAAGVSSLNIIDFENVYTWHTPGDNLDHIEPKSIEKAGRLALGVFFSF